MPVQIRIKLVSYPDKKAQKEGRIIPVETQSVYFG